MHQLLVYIKFLLKSTNQHGVHSPFVYSLLTQCLYNKDQTPAFKKVLEYRKALLNDHRKIEVKDFGAGSRVFKSNKRKVSAIAKNAGISKKRAVLLNRLTSYLNIQSALELGTSVGISSAAIATDNNVKLLTIEGCPETAEVAAEYFKRFGLENIQLKVGSFKEVLSGKWKEESGKSGPGKLEAGILKAETGSAKSKIRHGNTKISSNHRQPPTTSNKQQTENSLTTTQTKHSTTDNRQPTTDNIKSKTSNLQHSTNLQPTTYNLQQETDLIYFDGNHQKAATLKYFHQLLPLAHNDSVFIFDDIHWSKGMEEAWEEIKAHPEVRVTIDGFFWGIVFFRKEQEKEHFIIRL